MKGAVANDAALVSNARMYSVTAATAEAWHRLFAWVAQHADVAVEPVQHEPPLLLSDLWSRDDLGIAFMCGLPLAHRVRAPRILAQCVPSPARYGGEAVYCTDIVVAADSPHRTLADTFGRRAGYTLKDSQSGYYAFRHHLLTRHAEVPQPYAQVTGGLMNARGVITAIAQGRIDVGPLDGYVHDLLRHTDPSFAAAVRVVAQTGPTPIPAIVSTAALDSATLARLQAAFRASLAAAELRHARETLLIADFRFPEAEVYAPLAARAQYVDDAAAAPAWD